MGWWSGQGQQRSGEVRAGLNWARHNSTKYQHFSRSEYTVYIQIGGSERDMFTQGEERGERGRGMSNVYHCSVGLQVYMFPKINVQILWIYLISVRFKHDTWNQLRSAFPSVNLFTTVNRNMHNNTGQPVHEDKQTITVSENKECDVK